MGLEEEAVFFLLQRANAEHPIRSAFTRGSVRGSIYVEGVMDPNVISLLKITPGIIRKLHGVVRQIIDPSDGVKMLTMQDPSTSVVVGQWIQVNKGIYKGDVGFVSRLETWGAYVLLVPRLQAPNTDSSLKRKRTTVRPGPALFNPDSFKIMYKVDPIRQDDGSYTSRGLVFDHGLLRRKYDFHSLTPIFPGMPSDVLLLFQLSQHPTVLASDFPCPQEWIFEEGDQIIVRSSDKRATVTAVKPHHLEVDLATGEGVMAVSWHDISKAFVIGDFVSVTSGPFQGTTGWVEDCDVDIAYVLVKGDSSTEMKVYLI